MSRGMARASLDLIEAMRKIAEAARPITGRGIGYNYSRAASSPRWAGPTCSGSIACSNRRARTASSRGHWIVDETRELERIS